ncbi:MAG: hypothetical protein ACJ762_15875 [Solirubrobacteraceae bacterium]
MRTRHIIATATTLALAVVPAALASKPDDPGSKGKGHGKPAKAKNVVLKGIVVSSDATSVTVTVSKATKFGKALVGTDAQFTVTKVSAADGNADGVVDGLDLIAGDKVLVQAKLAKDAVAPFTARKVVDQTHPAVAETDED